MFVWVHIVEFDNLYGGFESPAGGWQRSRMSKPYYCIDRAEGTINEVTWSRPSDREFYYLCDDACQRQSKERCAMQYIHQLGINQVKYM
jgi:hypothetical protein